MSIRSLEAKILREVRLVSGNRKLRQKDIVEWSSGKVKRKPDEKIYYLERLALEVAVKVL